MPALIAIHRHLSLCLKAAVVEEPEGPKEQLTVRLVVPSELQLAYSLPYKDKKALIEFNHTQEFQVRGL